MPDHDARPSGAALDERMRIVRYVRTRAEEVRRRADPPATGVALAAIWSQIADEINTFRDLDGSAISAGPRVWTLPPEPGPEVKALADAEGEIWTPHPAGDGWCCTDGDDPDGISGLPWLELIGEFGPLTDATVEANHGPR